MVVNIDDIEYKTNDNSEMTKNPLDENINAEDFKILSNLPKLNADEIEDYLTTHKFKNINIKNSDAKIHITANSPSRLKSLAIKIYNRISNSYTAKILKKTKIKIGDILSEEIILKLEKAATLNSTDVVRRILDEEGNLLIVVHAFSDLPTKINLIGLNTIKARVLLDGLPLSRFYDKDFSSILQSYPLFRNTFDSSNIKDIEMRIMRNAQNIGYFDFKILKCDFSNEVDEYLNKYLNIIIDEGSRYKISNIDTESEIPIDLELLDQIKNIANANCDKYFAYKKIISIQNKINKILQNNKIYNLMCASSCEYLDGKVQLKFKLEDCHLPIIGSIKIFNNNKIKTSEIMKFIELSEGDYYNEIIFRQYIAIIEDVFKIKVNVAYEKLPQNKIGIMIDIIETEGGRFNFSTSHGLNIEYNNIGGRALNLKTAQDQLKIFKEEVLNTSQTLGGMIFDGFKKIFPTTLSADYRCNSQGKINIKIDGIPPQLSKLYATDVSTKYLTPTIFDMFKSTDQIEKERVEYYSHLLAEQGMNDSDEQKINFLKEVDCMSIEPYYWQIAGAYQHKLSDNANISGGIKVGRQNCVIKGKDEDIANKVIRELYGENTRADNIDSVYTYESSSFFFKLFSSLDYPFNFDNEDLDAKWSHYIEAELPRLLGKCFGRFEGSWAINDHSKIECNIIAGMHNYDTFTDNFNSSFNNKNNIRIFNCGAKSHYQVSAAYKQEIANKMNIYLIAGAYDLHDIARFEPKPFCGIGFEINGIRFEWNSYGPKIYFNY